MEGIFFHGLTYVFNVFDVFGLRDPVSIRGWGAPQKLKIIDHSALNLQTGSLHRSLVVCFRLWFLMIFVSWLAFSVIPQIPQITQLLLESTSDIHVRKTSCFSGHRLMKAKYTLPLLQDVFNIKSVLKLVSFFGYTPIH